MKSSLILSIEQRLAWDSGELHKLWGEREGEEFKDSRFTLNKICSAHKDAMIMFLLETYYLRRHSSKAQMRKMRHDNLREKFI